MDFSFDVTTTPVIGKQFIQSDESSYPASTKQNSAQKEGNVLSSPSMSSTGNIHFVVAKPHRVIVLTHQIGISSACFARDKISCIHSNWNDEWMALQQKV